VIFFVILNRPKFATMSKHYLTHAVLLFFISICSYGQTLQTEVNSQRNELVFEIFPNPLRSGILTIKSDATGPKAIFVYDIMGNLVHQIITQETMINLRVLKTGIYFLKIIQDEKTGLKRLVVH